MSRSLDERAGQAEPSSGSGVRLKVWGKRARGVDLCCKYALRTHTTLCLMWKTKSIRSVPSTHLLLRAKGNNSSKNRPRGFEFRVDTRVFIIPSGQALASESTW